MICARENGVNAVVLYKVILTTKCFEILSQIFVLHHHICASNCFLRVL